MAAHIGIDLGTTNSLVAVFLQGKPCLIPNALGGYLTPSCIGLLDDGRVVVGESARELAVLHPRQCASMFKRAMGTDQQIAVADQTFTAPQLSSLILASLKQDAERELGHPVTHAVVTVPAYFNEHQRQATQAAARIAGFESTRIINEPTAAALAYGLTDPTAEKKILVFDLGGGTFDVTLMDIFEGSLEIVATAGENFLGGEDFTTALAAQVLAASGLEFEHEEMQHPFRVARLLAEAETAKRLFNDQPEVQLRLPAPDGSLDQAASVAVARADWQARVAPLVARLRHPMLKVLRDAGLTADGLDEIILVGGASRMFFIPDLLREIFGDTPLRIYQPDHAIALGAAIHAAMIANHKDVRDLVMTDVCPHTLGVEIVKRLGNQVKEGYFLPLIHRNTTIPVSREESVATVAPGQTEIRLRVFQGEARRVEDNLEIGELVVKGLPPGPPGVEVLVRFTYDTSGLLDVLVVVPSTGARHSCLLNTGLKSLDETQLEAAKKALRSLRFFPQDEAPNQHLLLLAERMMAEVPAFERDLFEQILGTYEQALHSQDRAFFEAARTELVTALRRYGADPEAGPPKEA
jgi:molecular chaperone HscC